MPSVKDNLNSIIDQLAALNGTIPAHMPSVNDNISSIIGQLDALTVTIDALTAHTERTDNPHGVTAGQVGALGLGGGTVSGDIGLNGDTAGLFQRTVDHWFIPTDHFTTWSNWTWDSATFDGAPSGIDVTIYPSLARLIHNNITTNHFAYRVIGSTVVVTARMTRGIDSYIGLRVDDGSNNNYHELRLENGTGGTKYQQIKQYTRVSGGSVQASTILDNLFYEWMLLSIAKTPTTNLSYYGIDTPAVAGLNYPHAAWTPTRAGIIFGQRGDANNSGRAGFVDWIRL